MKNQWRFPLGIATVIYLLSVSSYAQEIEATPTETYKAYHEALQILDMKGIRARWLPQSAVSANEESLTKEILWARQMSPPNIDVVNEKILGEEAFLTVVGTYANGGRSEGKIYLVRQKDRWQVRGEAWGFIELPPPILSSSAEGVIAGVITLPQALREGDLYVFAVLKNQDRATSFTRIPKDQVVWSAMPYQIDHLPMGTYWVYAAWDTAEPFFGEEVTFFSASTGDYTGESSGTVTVDEGERRGKIDFACTRNLKPIEAENYGKDYSFVDLLFSKGPESKPKFLLRVKNEGEKPIQGIMLRCLINGRELAFASSAPGTLIPPKGERDFDITTCYESYVFFLEKVWEKSGLSKDHLTFELLSKENQAFLKKEIIVQ
ncbi:MAG: hypothetical protein HY590_06560 [Candidatus Omnitrophica bacterium]|nr:hypothetical protein [Candidatus Omnitrophota bacterium]